jgi:hypothetical protein
MMAAGQPLKVWLHGPPSLLPQPTKVTVGSLDWDIDDPKEALIAKATIARIGAPYLIVRRAVLTSSSGEYEATGDALAADIGNVISKRAAAACR